MALQVQNNNPNLKESVTDAKYQSTFLPIFQDAETRIKLLILLAFLQLKSPLILRMAIAAIINDVAQKIPDSLHDKKAYIEGMQKRSEIYIRNYYNQPKRTFEMTRSRIINTAPKDVVLPKLDTPKQLIDFTKDKKNLWAEAKGTPYIVDYGKEVNKKMDELAAMPMTTYEPGKKPISLWQKAELDVRYNKQLENLEKLKNEGVEFAYLSSHPDCSKRCECWQGSLVSLNLHAENPQKTVDKKFHYKKSSFFVMKLDGKNVYSLPDITDVMGPYGYKNNIYLGFNCRHRLIPYVPGHSEPTKYDEKDVAKQRAIEENIRKMERDIRFQRTRLLFYEKIGETKIVQNLKRNIKMMIERYKAYCEKNGYAWNEYRIRIREGSNKYL